MFLLSNISIINQLLITTGLCSFKIENQKCKKISPFYLIIPLILFLIISIFWINFTNVSVIQKNIYSITLDISEKITAITFIFAYGVLYLTSIRNSTKQIKFLYQLTEYNKKLTNLNIINGNHVPKKLKIKHNTTTKIIWCKFILFVIVIVFGGCFWINNNWTIAAVIPSLIYTLFISSFTLQLFFILNLSLIFLMFCKHLLLFIKCGTFTNKSPSVITLLNDQLCLRNQFGHIFSVNFLIDLLLRFVLITGTMFIGCRTINDKFQIHFMEIISFVILPMPQIAVTLYLVIQLHNIAQCQVSGLILNGNFERGF